MYRYRKKKYRRRKQRGGNYTFADGHVAKSIKGTHKYLMNTRHKKGRYAYKKALGQYYSDMWDWNKKHRNIVTTIDNYYWRQ